MIKCFYMITITKHAHNALKQYPNDTKTGIYNPPKQHLSGYSVLHFFFCIALFGKVSNINSNIHPAPVTDAIVNIDRVLYCFREINFTAMHKRFGPFN